MGEKNLWPSKTKEMHSNHFDSTIWNDFKFRTDDIIIATNFEFEYRGRRNDYFKFLAIW